MFRQSQRQLFPAAVSLVALWSCAVGSTIAADAPKGPAVPVAAPAKAVADPVSPPFSAQRLLRTFRSNNDEAKLQALETVSRFHRREAEVGDALWQVLKPVYDGRKPVTPVMLATFQVYGSLPDEKQHIHQLALLKASDIEVVLAVAAGMAERQAPEVVPAVAALRQRPEYQERYGIRHAVLSIVAQYKELVAIDCLIDILSNSDGQLKYEAARHLGRLTRQNFGGKSKDWRDWWRKHESEYDPSRALPVSTVWDPVDMPWEEPVPRLAGMPIYAKRILFVVDRSGSTKSQPDGGNGLENAKREFERFAYELPTSVTFNILAFDARLKTWRDRLVPANVPNAANAMIFMFTIFSGGSTSIYDALESGLNQDPNLELIVFVSDGVPTTGKIVDRAVILRAIGLRNNVTRVTMHALGMYAQGPGEEFMKRLASQNRGAYRAMQ